MARIQDRGYPDDFYYDIENQIWYEPLADDRVYAKADRSDLREGTIVRDARRRKVGRIGALRSTWWCGLHVRIGAKASSLEPAIAPAFSDWIAAGAYKDRTE